MHITRDLFRRGAERFHFPPCTMLRLKRTNEAVHIRCPAWQVLRDAMDEQTQIYKAVRSWTGQHTHARSGVPVPACALRFEERRKRALLQRGECGPGRCERRRGVGVELDSCRLLPGHHEDLRGAADADGRAAHAQGTAREFTGGWQSALPQKALAWQKKITPKPIVWRFRSRSNIVTGSGQGCDCDFPST